MNTKVRTTDGKVHYLRYCYTSGDMETMCNEGFNRKHWAYTYNTEEVTCDACKIAITKRFDGKDITLKELIKDNMPLIYASATVVAITAFLAAILVCVT